MKSNCIELVIPSILKFFFFKYLGNLIFRCIQNVFFIFNFFICQEKIFNDDFNPCILYSFKKRQNSAWIGNWKIFLKFTFKLKNFWYSRLKFTQNWYENLNLNWKYVKILLKNKFVFFKKKFKNLSYLKLFKVFWVKNFQWVFLASRYVDNFSLLKSKKKVFAFIFFFGAEGLILNSFKWNFK